jgi:hypothetical protein
MSKINVKKCCMMPPNLSNKKDQEITILFEWEGGHALRTKK